jgi:hydroxymethylpyrimidine pyrophosphatase-like HAD family hydrolase
MALKIIELDIEAALSAETRGTEVAIVEMPAIETEFVYFGRQQFYKAPEYVAETACRAIRENEERGNPAATQTGKIRAQQLCKREEISLETIKRMKSYLERAATYNSGDWDDNGTISYNLWGGENGLKWVNSILDSVKSEEMDINVVALPPYIQYETGKTQSDYVFVERMPGEPRDEYIGRCVANARKEGYPEDQAVAMCISKADDFNCGCTQMKQETEFSLIGFIDGEPVFNTPEEAQLYGEEKKGCSGYHEHTDEDGNVVYMACDVHPEVPSEDNGVELETLLEQGWYIEDVREVDSLAIQDRFKQQFNGITKEKFYQILTDPNADSVMDIFGKKFRYVYATGNGQPDIIADTRNFCMRMLGGRQFVFRYEDIQNLNAQITSEDANRKIIPRPKGTSPDIFTWKGSGEEFANLLQFFPKGEPQYDFLKSNKEKFGANCRHYWLELVFGTVDPNETEYTKKINNQKRKMISEAELVIPAVGQSGQVNPKADPARGARDTFKKASVQSIIVDIDGTLFNGVSPNSRVVEYVNKKWENHRIIIVTGRPDSRYGETVRELDRAGIKWDDLLMSDRSTNQAPEFKRDTAKKLKEELKLRIVQAIDDNGAARRYYRQLGIDAISPNNVSLKLIPVGFLQGLPIFDDRQDASDWSYDMGCGGIVEELEYMGEKRFQACSYSKKQKMAKVEFKADEEQRMLYSPLMVPNILIPRMDEFTGERYFVKFTPEAVEKIQRKFMIEQRLRSTNYEHTDYKFEDMVMVESWLVNGESDKAYTLGFTREQIPTGTWMVGYKILETPEGDKIWNDLIKKGVVKGLSIEGEFLLKFSRQKSWDYLLDEIINIIKQIN